MTEESKSRKFWNKLRFTYRVSILNEKTLSESFHLRLSRLSVFLILCAFALVSFALLSLLIFLTPIKHYLPGYTDSSIRTELVNEVLYVDSISEQLSLQEWQLASIKNIISGEISADSVTIDSLKMVDWKSLNLDKSEQEKKFCKNFEKEEKYNLGSIDPTHAKRVQVFVNPAKGVVVQPFDVEHHNFGVDITTAPNEVVLASLDGTILSVDYSLDEENVVCLQHADGIVTLYRNCGRVLKKAGDRVHAGEAIGFVGSNKNGAQPFIHFEIWQKGVPVNPSEHISF